MYDSETVPSRQEGLYKTFLYFYPENYRKKFGQEMLFAFRDLYQEELVKNGNPGIHFWLAILVDTGQSIIAQHGESMKKQGIKNYLHITAYNIIGGILLLPFLTLLGLDILGRLVQGDFYHYNRAWYAAITHSVLYKEPFLLQSVFIFGPILAVLLNVFSFYSWLQKTKKPTFWSLIFRNPLAFVIVGLGFLCLLIVYGHDVVPCFVHGLLRVGIGQLPYIVSICNNA